MGFSLSWAAVPSSARDRLLDRLALSPTGEFEEVPESATSGVHLPTGWYVVVANRCDYVSGRIPDLAAVSRASDVVACSVEEHVMASFAWGWSAGRLAWEVSHDAQAGRRHLEQSGDVPAAYAGIRDRLLAELHRDPDGPDYVFDIPVALAEAITGFRHDGALGEGMRFEVLGPRPRRRWWPWGFSAGEGNP
jgi:hypothetical protein